MKTIKIIISILILSTLLVSCNNTNSINKNTLNYNNWYEWAENNDIDNFNDCDNEFWSNYWWAEDWCNKYVQETYYNWSTSFWKYECTEDCSWHEAGYEWAEDNWIDNEDDC